MSGDGDILGTPARIGPFDLPPLTFGRYLALRQIGSPYLLGGERLPTHFANAIWICQGPMSGDLCGLYHRTMDGRRMMLDIANKAAQDFEAADTELLEWLQLNTQYPKFHTHHASPLNIAGTNPQIEIAHNLWSHYGIAWKDALTLPMATAIAMHVSAMERRGFCRVSDSKREAAIQAADEAFEAEVRRRQEKEDGAEL